jgi:hypothetical protein
VSVIDLEPAAAHHRPCRGRRCTEGLAISPKGDVAVAVLLAGSDNKNAYFHHRNGSGSLRIDGSRSRRSARSGRRRPGRRSLHAGWQISADRQLPRSGYLLKVDGSTITSTGKRFKLRVTSIGRNEHAIDNRHALLQPGRYPARGRRAAGYARTNNNTWNA